MTDLIYKNEAFEIIGAAIEVHRTLGAGFLEAVYQQALEIEFQSRSINFISQPEIKIRYKDTVLGKTFIPDFTCYENIIVEIKSIQSLTFIEKAQIINYLKVSGYQLGLLINFGSMGKLEWQRVVL